MSPRKWRRASSRQLGQLLAPLVLPLDRVMDKRLLRTLVQTVQVILTFRDRMNGLLLSELGGYLLHPAHAPAGTKRLSRLLHCPDWQAQHVDAFLWQQASEQFEAYQEKGEESLAIWDSSEWEKPETEDNEDLCAVRSNKGQRLTHIKPGYFTPPGRPIFVPGLHWIGVVLVGLSAQARSPELALIHYWSSRGVHASFKVDEEGKVRRPIAVTAGAFPLASAAGKNALSGIADGPGKCTPVCWPCRCAISDTQRRPSGWWFVAARGASRSTCTDYLVLLKDEMPMNLI